MIIKELDPFTSEDKFLKAGHAAEEKMSFYLRVDFDDDKEVHVLNSIRIELDDGAVQIDHLVIHPWGITIVESKSVTGKIQIKDDGQWIRWFNDKSSGMQSPIAQATIQAKRLRKYLNRTAKPEGFFEQVTIDILVAISDQGIIIFPKSGQVEGVLKADQIVEKIQGKLATFRKHNEPVLMSKHMDAIGHHLVSIHRPLISAAAEIKIPQVVTPIATSQKIAEPEPIYSNNIDSSPACKHCNGTRLEALGGKYGYYFRCLDCGKNTAIQDKCSVCGQTEKIHKRGNDFTAECGSCNASRPFYSNISPAVASQS